MASKRAAQKPEQRRIRNANRGTGVEEADWGEANAGLIAQAVTAVSKRMCAIQFGLTKDAGAFVVRIVGDGEPYNEFIRATEDIDLYLTGLIEDFLSIMD
jgi:hypothetical protein